MYGAILCAGALALSGCKETAKTVDETVGVPVGIVGSGVKAVGKGVGQLGKAAEESVVGELLTDRNRHSLLREHRDLSDHLGKVESFLRRQEINLPDRERKILQSAKDRLAAAGRLLESKRITASQGRTILSQFDSVHETFSLFRKTYSTPRYEGYVYADPSRSLPTR